MIDSWVFVFNEQESSSHMNLKGEGECNRRAMPSTNNTDELEAFLYLHFFTSKMGTGIQKPIYSVSSDHTLLKDFYQH